MTDLRPPSLDTTERETLKAFLDYLRECLVRKLDGLEERDARRPMVPSGTNLLGLVQHATAGEHYWFEHVFRGVGEEPDFGMEVPVDRGVDDVVADFRAAVRRSGEVLGDCRDLEQRAARGVSGREPHTMRWILLHLVEEYARHAGHADILREQIDGTTGR